MANIIQGSYKDAGAILGGSLTLDDRNFFMDNARSLASRAKQVGLSYFDHVVDIARDFNFGESYNRIESLASRVNKVSEVDCIRYLSNPESITMASQSMVRWVMAHRKTRTYFNKGRIKGYGEDYYDNNPGTVGIDQYDYRKATDGVMVKEGDKVVIRQFIDTTFTDDVELTTMNKIDIARTWRVLDAHYDVDEDDELIDLTDEDWGLIE